MFTRTRLAVLSPFMAFIFYVGILTSLPACGTAEDLYNQAIGNVVDDGAVRTALAQVNSLAGDAVTRTNTLIGYIQTAGASSDSATVSSLWIDKIGPEADALVTNLNQLSDAESRIQDNLARLRTTERANDFVFVAAVVAVAGLWAFGKFCQRKRKEMDVLKQQEADALANGDADALNKSKQGQVKVGQDVLGEIGKSVVLNGVSAGPGAIGAVGDALTIADTANSVTTEVSEGNKVKVVGSTSGCQSNQRSTERAAALSEYNCRVYIGDASPIGKLHIAHGIPVGSWNIMGFLNGIARIYENGVNIAEGVRTRIEQGLIPVDQATADKIKQNQDGTYTEPGPTPPQEITVKATGSASGGYSSAPQSKVIDGSSQLTGYTVVGVSVSLTWQAYTIKDRFKIIYGGRTVYDSGNVSGGATGSADVTGSSPQVTIQVITPSGGTAWNWRASVSYVAIK